MKRRPEFDDDVTEDPVSTRRAVPLGVQFGFVRSVTPFDSDALQQRIRNFALLWPVIVAAAALGLGPSAVSQPGSVTDMLTLSAVILACAVPFFLFRALTQEKIKPHVIVIILIACTAILGAKCGEMALHVVGDESTRPDFVLLVTSGFVIMGALSRLPVTMLAFAVALIATLIFGLGSPQALPFLLPMGLCTALIAIVSARADFSHARQLWKAEQEASRPARLLDQLEQGGSTWFWETDRRGRILYISARIAQALGYRPDNLIGKMLTSIVDPHHQAASRTAGAGERTLPFHLSIQTAFNDLEVRAATEDERWWSLSGRPVYDRFDHLRGFIGTGIDLTDVRRTEAENARLARFDVLTGLVNRAEISNLLRQAIVGQGGVTRPSALLLLDLDRFKNVNDTLGHPAGDALLKQVAQRVMNVIGSHGHVGRLGGDEFKIVVPGEASRTRLDALAAALIESVSRPYVIERTQVSIGVSVGIAIAPEDGRSDSELTRNADLALYAAKAAGRGVLRFYEPEMHAAADRRNMLEKELNKALENDALRLVYQPVVSCADEQVTGFEALLRWTHPELGVISPAEFIPIAEESSLIERVGEWVLRHACEEASRWGIRARVAVNVSPTQFSNPAFPTLVAQVLAQTGLPPHRLELEITEGVFMAEDGQAEARFETLRRIGVRLALDDFGTGYSSLGYLQRAPLNKIKIDRSFVRGATLGDNQNAAIIRSIVSLAEALGMETTAEGAETEDEIELIRGLGCSHIQGFFYGPPLEVADLRQKMGMDGSAAQKVGPKISRAARKSILQHATFSVDGKSRLVRMRNVSTTGTMIELPDYIAPDTIGSLSIQDGPTVIVRCVWWADNRCGLAFSEPLDLAWMVRPQVPLQRAG